MTEALRITGLVKRFADVRAVDGVSLDVAPGEVRGLLGANGAGKTTLLRMVLGLVRPDAGSIELFGRAVGGDQGVVLDEVAGFVEEPGFYPYLTGRANLEFLAELDRGTGWDRIDDALDTVGLTKRARDRVGGYSSGMRQRLGIAAALLRAPRLLLLDEPTSALDPAGALDVLALLRELSSDGVAVLLSSHQLGEVEAVCDTFTVLRHGRVAWEGDAAQLRSQAPVSAYRLVTSDDALALEIAGSYGGLGAAVLAGGGLSLTADEASLDAYAVAVGSAGVSIRRLELEAGSLETIFFSLSDDGVAGGREEVVAG